jgi:outer membrane protein OmpA-like peptidoglycan-associated protein
VYFDYDRSELTENAKRLLAQVAEILVNETRFIVTVEGHTDARGTEDYNISLGARRSTVVREFLIAYGVDANRLVSVSYGKERPKEVRRKLTEKYPFLKEGDVLTEEYVKALSEEEQQEACNQLNRRTEFRVLRTTYGLFEK